MMGSVLVLVFLTTLVAICLWPAVREWRRETTRLPESGMAPEPAVTPRAETLEGVLARQVIGREISKQQYAHAMHGLAMRDRDRHPLPDLPDDLGRLSFAIAAMIDLDLEARQALLASRSPLDRLRRLDALLSATLGTIVKRAHVHTIAKSNGRDSHPQP